MQQVVECVANFSEGLRTNVIDEIVSCISSVKGVALLAVEYDADHNRSVVTFAGLPDAVADAAFAGVRAASALIDMRRHRGQHPRIGAADVVPFVPLKNVSMDDCVRLARALGARVGNELKLPVFLYEDAALREENRNLANIRRGGYEGLCKTIAVGQTPQPDFGPRKIGKAGACAIGARDILIALNVYLATDDVAVAKRIAREVRESSGGLPHVKALGLSVKGRAQVSMNLTNYKVTSICRAIEAVRQEAHKYRVAIESTELVGLLPADALLATDASYVQIDNFNLDRVLDIRLAKMLNAEHG